MFIYLFGFGCVLVASSLPRVGILADEGSNDRMDALVASGKHPIDIILLFASAEGDVPKIEEILEAGADPKVGGAVLTS
jgi:hypothetical protein